MENQRTWEVENVLKHGQINVQHKKKLQLAWINVENWL